MLGAVCALLSSLTWAVGSAVYSRYSETYSSFSINFVRALISLPLFLLAELWISGSSGIASSVGQVEFRHVIWLMISMVASYGLGDALFFLSVRCLGITSAMAIASVYPLWLALVDTMISGTMMPLMQLSGVIIVVSGVITVILAGRNGATPSIPNRRGLGVLLALLTSVFWSLNSFSVSRGGDGISPFIGNFIRMVFALNLCWVLFKVSEPRKPNESVKSRRPFWIPLSVLRWHLLIFAGEAFGGSAFFLYGLSHSPLAISGTLSSLAPVLSVPIGLVTGSERFSLVRTIGVVLVCLGIFFLLSPSG